eukprot:SAG25_NODE_2664_length_1459_cov_38.941176_2_plen_37_part_01
MATTVRLPSSPSPPHRGSAWCLLLWVLVQLSFCSRQL